MKWANSPGLSGALMEEASAIDQRARRSPLPRVARFRFQLEAAEPIRLPAYPGSVWRGLLGLGLRRTAAQTVGIDKDPGLHWHDWTRYSGRQKESMKMGGLLGDLRLHGLGLSTFWPALWHGQWVHLGKGTSFGLGVYRVEALHS